MPLRAKKPEHIQKRLKALFYGGAGVGKTMAAIQFPNPYLIDTEKGAENDEYVRLLNKNNGVIFQTTDFHEMLQEVKALLSEKHSYKTLIIDPLTIVYNDLVEKASKDGTEFARHYAAANMQLKPLLNLLLRLDMNVIITAHAKSEYAPGSMTVVGQTFDCYKKLDYLFDLAFEIKKQGKERIGYVTKTRVEEFPEGSIFPFSFKEIAQRYGEEKLTKEVQPEILATGEQLEEIKRLIEMLHIPSETVEKWLRKAESYSLEEMETSKIQKCIDHLNSKIKGLEGEKNAK